MIVNKGFDNEKYLAEQTAAIRERVGRFNDRLYLEFGGKLLYDYHAARVLPGFDPNVKMRLLQKLADDLDVIMCIYAGDIERKKLRADFGITYDADAMKTIDDFSDWGIDVSAVLVTRYEDQPSAKSFIDKLRRRGVQVFTHRHTRGYPSDVDAIVSDEGYGANEYIPMAKSIVVVTGPGPGSGKLATCLNQLYHEYKRGLKAGYAKFETFPIWNVPLAHKVNVAYEAATVDLKDYNLIDHFHLETYNEKTVNYNRDIEAFPLLRRILEKITGEESIYKSPTDMGVNRVGFGIVDEEAVSAASHQEIVRRFFRTATEYALGLADKETLERSKLIMEKIDATESDRAVVKPARQVAFEAEEQGKGNRGVFCGAAIELPDGTIITGKNSPLLHSTSALIINAIKHLTGIPDKIHLLPENIIQSLGYLKEKVLGGKEVSLDLEETLISLSVSAIHNPSAKMAVESLKELDNCEVHLSHIPPPGDEAGLRKLGVNLTCDPEFSTKSLFMR